MAQYSDHLTHACTFTIKQEINGRENDAEQAWDLWGDYCAYLNRTIYKHAVKRYGKSLVILPTLHGEGSHKRLHFHAAIGCVDRKLAYDKLKVVIEMCWRRLRGWTDKHLDIQPYKDEGWISYMLHESDRLDLHSVDITRCCLPKVLN